MARTGALVVSVLDASDERVNPTETILDCPKPLFKHEEFGDYLNVSSI